MEPVRKEKMALEGRAETPKTGLTLATKFTIVRLLGVPVFATLLVYYTLGLERGEPNELLRAVAAGLFLAVCLTDAFDGYLARSRNEVTRLGKFLDPVADKALLLSALILLTRPRLEGLDPHIPLWLTAIVLSRDAVIVVGYFIIHHVAHHVEIHPRWSGKLATLAQMGAVLWVLMQQTFLFPWLAGIAAGLTLVSLAQYVLDGVRQLEKAGHR